MERPLRARLGAAKLLLQEHVGKASHQPMSRLQRDAVQDLLKAWSSDAGTRAEISELLLQVPWFGEDGNFLLGLLVPAEAPAPKRRRAQQSYEAILEYGTQQIWDTLMNSGPAALKLHTVISWAMGLGLRCPTEHSLKFLTSLWLYVSETQEELARTTREQKQGMLQHFKREFDRCRKNMHDPPVYLIQLPDQPLLLLRDYEVLYRSFYKDGAEPCQPAVDPKRIRELDCTYSCRGGQVPRTPTAAPAAAQSMEVASLSSPMAGMERVANLFMDRLGSLQSSQQKLLELLVTGGASSGLQQSVNLNALADLSSPQQRRTPTRRQPTITFAADASLAGSTPALPAPAAQLPRAVSVASLDTPPLQQGSGDAGVPPPQQEAEEETKEEEEHREPEQQAALALPSKPQVPQRAQLETMLDMLQERDGDRRRSRQSTPKLEADQGTAAGKTKGKGLAAGTSTGSQVAGQPKPAGKGKGKDKGKSKGIAKGTSSGKQVGSKKAPVATDAAAQQGDTALVRFGPAEISHERSNQFLARTGLRGKMQSKSFSYGPKGRLSALTATSPILASNYITDPCIQLQQYHTSTHRSNIAWVVDASWK